MPTTSQVPTGEPEAVPTKRDLASWWKSFTRGGNAHRKQDAPAPGESQDTAGIFGVELQKSIKYANVAISLQDANGATFTYGYVPIVVAKCGVFLKEKATETQGIFRLAGAERRVKELQKTFNTPERYGKGLDWEGYTVHDAAGVLRRYFNALPEPVIPWSYYDKFRKPLIGHQAQAVGAMPSQRPTTGEFDHDAAIKTYQTLITQLPPLNRQLLLYILDLLAVFAAKSEANSMDASNLAVIFQPGTLHHPDHNMSPDEYRLNQDVLIFLIDNQDHFIVGMEGTEADEKTIAEVTQGSQKPKPSSATHSQVTSVNRTTSNASAGAESLRKFGGIRRNVSVSSRRSKQSTNSPSPVTPPPDGPYAVGSKSGVHRSNTVPSRKSGSPVVGGKLPQKVPAQVKTATQPSATGEGTSSSIGVPPASPQPAVLPTASQTDRRAQVPPTSAQRSPQPQISQAPYSSGRMSPHLRPVLTAKERARSNERKPNKLQKKRQPENGLSAHSSTQSLGATSNPTSPAHVGSRITDAQRLEAFDPTARDLPEPVGDFALADKDSIGPGVAPAATASGAEPRASTGSRSEGAGGYSSADNLSGAEGAKKHSRWNFSISHRKDKDKDAAASREKK